MKKRELYEILNEVKEGKLPVNEAVFELKKMPFEDLGYAKIDYHRELRQGYGEVIFGQGKTAEQIIGILTSMKAAGQNTILITRLYQEAAEKIKEKCAPAARPGHFFESTKDR